MKFIATNKRTGEVEIIEDLYWFEENGVHENGENDWVIAEFGKCANCKHYDDGHCVELQQDIEGEYIHAVGNVGIFQDPETFKCSEWRPK